MIARQKRFGRLSAALGLVQALALVPRWLARVPQSGAARADERRFMARIARRLVNATRIDGAPDGGPGTLYVGNHISWLDIAVLGSALDASFIAKADVQRWPLIGRLSRRTGTIFIVREERHRVHHQAGQIETRLKAGDSLILFPEGTTSDGLEVLPFRTSLFEAAQHAARIQPFAICYARRDGAPLDAAQMAQVGWHGEEPLAVNFNRLVRIELMAQIRLMPCLAPIPGESRKALAERCRAAVMAAHGALRRGA